MKVYNPVTSTLRHTVLVDHELYLGEKGFWEKYLSQSVNEKGGRNDNGRITVRHRGSMTNRRSRRIESTLVKGISGEVKALVYDSNRSGWLMWLRYSNGMWSYQLGYSGCQVGDKLMNWEGMPLYYTMGDRMLVEHVMPGTTIYNLESKPHEGGKYLRSAGSSGLVLRKDEEKVYIKLASGKVVGVSRWCLATIGISGNKYYRYQQLGKAGRTRWLGFRPIVRGLCMNPVDHPHGGGEGKKSKKATPRTPWGKLSSGQKLKKNK
jgi:large subunit ribosomal protein L2